MIESNKIQEANDAKDYVSVHSKNGGIAELVKYIIPGILFGIVFVKAQLFSWIRIQEMFRFHSFHMYGVIGSAVLVGIVSIWLLKKWNIHTVDGENIHIEPKPYHKGVIIGGLIFGLGWAVTGACPGPLYALIGYGYFPIIITLLSSLVGVWVFGYFKDKLPF
jgi:uncharacterized protein